MLIPFILFLNEWTSKCGIFTPHWILEETPECERVSGGLGNRMLTFFRDVKKEPSRY